MAITSLPIRQEQSASYKTLIKSSLVTSLRSVFTQFYKDSQFQNLRIDPEFSLTRVTWPAIYIRYNEGEVRNAGVGHLEYFPDPSGFIRKWMHSIFEGTIEFDIITESPLDRDILSDALVEVIRFGTLDPLLNSFFTGIYGNVTDPYSNLAVMQQIGLNSDTLIAQGESFSPSPWGAEDLPIYQTSYAIDVLGGYYNSLPTSSLTVVREVIQFPYLEDDPLDDLPFDDDPSNMWLYPFAYVDEDYVAGVVAAYSREANLDDQGTIRSISRISSGDTHQCSDVDAAIGVALFQTDEVHDSNEASTATILVAITSIEQFSAADVSAASSLALSSALESYNTADTAAIASIANHSARDTVAAVDLTQVGTSIALETSIDTATYIDAATVT